MVNKYFLVTLLFVLLLSGCISKTEGGAYVAPNAPLVTSVSVQEVPVVYTSLAEISSKADVIAIASAMAEKEIVNTARDPDDPNQPDSQYFSVGQVFEVEVEEYVIGGGPKIIYVIQNQGFLVTRDGQPTTADINKATADYNYTPISLGRKYLMFLRRARPVYENYAEKELFGGIGHPWLFDLSNPDCVRPEDAVDIFRFYPPQPLAEIRRSIAVSLGVEEPGGIAYPTAGVASPCTSEILTGGPYPYPYP